MFGLKIFHLATLLSAGTRFAKSVFLIRHFFNCQRVTCNKIPADTNLDQLVKSFQNLFFIFAKAIKMHQCSGRPEEVEKKCIRSPSKQSFWVDYLHT
jgi:hypothetical protein